ncbi:MAG TPA: hypothetical protein VFU15_15975, partial [Bacteroidia bacterium]|nr:hypothetical protein [Bacteroidia bacterium]
LSGAGGFISISHTRLQGGGIYIPLAVEYIPALNRSHCLSFNVETDAMFTLRGTRFSGALRPLFCVAWMFTREDWNTKSR